MTLGREACRRDLASSFGFIKRPFGPERLIRACGRIWGEYYRDAGHMDAVRWAPQDTTLRIHDFPHMHPAHCRLMEGWMWQGMVAVGATVLDGGETQCPHRGGAYHEFAWTWR